MLWAINASPQPKSATTWEDGLQSKLSKNNKIIHSTLSSWTPHCDGYLPKNGHLQYIATDWCSLHNMVLYYQPSQANTAFCVKCEMRGEEKNKVPVTRSIVLALPPIYAYKYWLMAVIDVKRTNENTIHYSKIFTFLATRNTDRSINHRK